MNLHLNTYDLLLLCDILHGVNDPDMSLGRDKSKIASQNQIELHNKNEKILRDLDSSIHVKCHIKKVKQVVYIYV